MIAFLTLDHFFCPCEQIRYYGLLNEPRLLVTDPELVKDILVTRAYNFVKSPMLAKSIGEMMGFGILVAEVFRVLNAWFLMVIVHHLDLLFDRAHSFPRATITGTK